MIAVAVRQERVGRNRGLGAPMGIGWSMGARVVVRDGLVAEWHVFADDEPIRRRTGG